MAKLYRMLSFYYAFIFGLPFYLTGFEYLMKLFQGDNTGHLFGVTLASSGLAFIAEGFKQRPVVNPTLSFELRLFITNPGFSVKYKYDEILFRFSIVCLLICLLIWYYTCSLSLSTWTNPDLSQEEFEILRERSMFFGWVNYLTGMLIAVLKA